MGPKFNQSTWATVKDGQTGRSAPRFTNPKPSKEESAPASLPPSPDFKAINFPLPYASLVADTATLPPRNPTGPAPAVYESEDEAYATDATTGDLDSRLEGMNISGFERRFHGKVSPGTLQH